MIFVLGLAIISNMSLSPEREQLFEEVAAKLHYQAEVYPLGERFIGLPENLSRIVLLDVTQVPGCHYGLKNVFVPIIRNLEETRNKGKTRVTPETAILIESSTGNAWIALEDAAKATKYESIIIMPDGLPESRYQHPLGIPVQIIKTPRELYVQGLPLQLEEMMGSNLARIRNREKIYVSPNHSVAAGDITVNTMKELGKQLIDRLQPKLPLDVYLSMGNGASACALGEYVRDNTEDARVIATESFAYGGGYDRFMAIHGGKRYEEIFGFKPGNPTLMEAFKIWGTNAPIGVDLPLQGRAINGSLLFGYRLFADEDTLRAFAQIPITSRAEVAVARALPNYDMLPDRIKETYGNSTLANIAVAAHSYDPTRITVAMAYDGRGNY